MTIKWVKVDPLVMSRRAVLLRHPPDRAPAAGTAPRRLRPGPPAARASGAAPRGIAHAYRYAAEHRDRYAEFFERDGSLMGPGLTADEAAVLPEHLRLPGLVVGGKPGAPAGGPRPPPET